MEYSDIKHISIIGTPEVSPSKKCLTKSEYIDSFYAIDDESLINFINNPRITSYGNRFISNFVIEKYHENLLERDIKICGWVRYTRVHSSKSFRFLEVNDGSTVKHIQVIVDNSIDNFDLIDDFILGAIIAVVGKLIKSSGQKHMLEIVLNENAKHYFKIFGRCDLENYKLIKSKNKTKLETLREIAHLRPRTNISSCITRIRSSLAQALHHFFQNLGFIQVNTPIITQLDCENSKELFQITTLSEDKKIKWIKLNNDIDSVNFENTNIKLYFSEISKNINENKEKIKEEDVKSSRKESALNLNSNYAQINPNNYFDNIDISDDFVINHEMNCSEIFSNISNDISNSKTERIIETSSYLLKTADMENEKNELDLSCDLDKNMTLKELIENKNLIKNSIEDEYILVTSENKNQIEKFVYDQIFSFELFKQPSFLTNSGQLELESYSLSFSDVYNFGPTFRFESEYSERHLAEFWMLEVETCFTDLEDSMNMAENFLKFSIEYIFEKNFVDLSYIDNNYSKGLLTSLKFFLEKKFHRISYTEAIEILLNVSKNKKFIFKEAVIWGINLSSEHEKYLTDIHFKSPVFLFDFPKRLKKFYMKENKDGETVKSFDLLIPHFGEIVGGSEREVDSNKIRESLNKEFRDDEFEKMKYKWYLELREFGCPIHSGFGVGFDRLVMLATGILNIKDVNPYPRYPKHADF